LINEVESPVQGIGGDQGVMSYINIHSIRYKGPIPVKRFMEDLKLHRGAITAGVVKRVSGISIEDAPKLIDELKIRQLLRHVQTDNPKITYQLRII